MHKKQKTYWLHCKSRKNGNGCNQPGVRLKEAQAGLLTRLNAETFLSMFEEQQGGQKQNALALAITRQASAQGVVDQIAAGIAAGELAMAAEADAAVLGVLARRQAQQEQKFADAKAALMAAQGELQQLQTMPGARVIAVEAQQQIRDLLKTFAGDQDSVEDRRAVQHHLGRIGLRVHVDGDERQLGLQVGDGAIDWQPLVPALDMAALGRGMAGTVTATFDADDETLELLDRLPKTAEGLIDLGAALGGVGLAKN
jgi:hypothetical protein